MKELYKTLSILIMAISCNAQTPIISIEDNNGDRIQNAYYKDISNVLNTFEGTYLLSNGTTSLKIVLQKKTMSFDSWLYEDLLIGEYQYIENGVEKVNTLNNLNTTYTNQYGSINIYGNSIIKHGLPGCNDCTINEKRLRLSFKDAISGCWADLIINKTISYQFRNN